MQENKVGQSAPKITVLLAIMRWCARGFGTFWKRTTPSKWWPRPVTGPRPGGCLAHVRPMVAVLDIRMPEMTGIELTKRIKATYPEIKVLILTAYDEEP